MIFNINDIKYELFYENSDYNSYSVYRGSSYISDIKTESCFFEMYDKIEPIEKYLKKKCDSKKLLAIESYIYSNHTEIDCCIVIDEFNEPVKLDNNFISDNLPIDYKITINTIYFSDYPTGNWTEL